jgi:anti-sigma B factor antagonist
MTRAHFQLSSVATENTPTSAEVSVTGEVDAGNVAEFSQAVEELAAPRPVILHLSDVNYFDSAGFAALDRLLAHKMIALVIAPSSLICRAAELMCIPLHHDAATARLALQASTN